MEENVEIIEETCDENGVIDRYIYRFGDTVNVSIPIDVYGNELPERLLETVFTIEVEHPDGQTVIMFTGSEENNNLEHFIMPYEHVVLYHRGGDING